VTAEEAVPADNVPAINTTATFVDPEAGAEEAQNVAEGDAAKAEAPKAGADEAKKETPKAGADEAKKDTPKEGTEEAKKDAAPAAGQEEEKALPLPEATPEDWARRRARAAEFKPLGEKFFQFPVSGVYYTRYRLRKDGDTSDQDIYQFLSMDFGDKERHAATAHLDARMSADLDGKRKGLRADVFSGLVDTYDSSPETKLYSAYVDFNKLAGVDFLRAGRQFNYDTPEIVQFDGLRLDTKPWFGKHETVFSFYGGLPVHLYEHSPKGDALGGVAAEGRPWQGGRLRLDYIHVTDDLSGEHADSAPVEEHALDPVSSIRHDDLISLSLWQTFRKPDVRVQGRFSVLDGEPRDGLARVIYSKPESQLQVAATYRAWFERQGRLATEFDTFFDTLRGQEPYHHGSLVVTKGWNDYFWMESGVWVRRLLNGNKEAEFNREFDRYYQTFQIRDLPIKGLSYSVTGSWWDGKGRATDTAQVGADVTYSCKKEFESSIGTDYALYKYDLFTNTEHDRVRSYYVKQRWRPTKWATLDVKYEYERSLDEDFHTLTATFRFTF
jgi:hypothetical protein